MENPYLIIICTVSILIVLFIQRSKRRKKAKEMFYVGYDQLALQRLALDIQLLVHSPGEVVLENKFENLVFIYEYPDAKPPLKYKADLFYSATKQILQASLVRYGSIKKNGPYENVVAASKNFID